jgi:hypothetical protein
MIMASILSVLGFLALIWVMLSCYERVVEKAAEHRDDGAAAPPA